jgi:hypothetical protein
VSGKEEGSGVSRARSLVAGAAAAAVLGATAGAATATTDAATATYSLRATSRCLAAHGAIVGRVRPLDSRLRSLRDLAQRTSIQAEYKTGRVGLAFGTSESGAKLLVELLTVPKDPLRYVLVRRANVVLMYRTKHKAAFRSAQACLR